MAAGSGPPIRAGYDRWAQVYDHDGNPLVALEEPLVREAVGMAAVEAGFRLEGIDERAPDAPFAERYPRARNHIGWPMLVVLRLQTRA